MLFGLRNDGATYQRLLDKAFNKQIDRNLEVYVDDLVIKSCTEGEIVRDIEETFKTLREINMKLHLKKCTFVVEEGMFLGYKVNTKGLKVKPDKVPGQISKEVTTLIAELPMLTEPMEKEELIVYLAAAKETVSAVLRPRVSVKGQILADFIVERPEEDSPDTSMEEKEELPEPWILFTNRSSCTDGSRARLILTNPEGIEFTYALSKCGFTLSGNQVNGTYVAKEADMIRYLEKVKALTGGFKAFTIKQIPRSENKKADALSKIASTSFAHLSKQVLVEELKEKSISEVEILTNVEEEEGDTWMTPIYKYLTEETIPADIKKARAIRRRPLQANYVLREIHEGSCSMQQAHNSSWPRLCGPGIDIAGPFPKGPGKVKFLIVAMDYFTKWIEAKPVATITSNEIKNFVLDNIVCRFGLPEEIISDNGKQFRDEPFKDWCEKLCINKHFAFVKHPQINRLVERANRSLGKGIKARLEARSKN
ncbi:reverse transcriptase domain-containing protein [Tanacetum coccineum]